MINSSFRPTYAEINLKNLAFNYKQLKKIAGRGIKLLAAVKANAYGHGIVEISKTLEKLKVDYLGVASIDEAIFLRKSKIKTNILVMGIAFSDQEIKQAVKYKITLTIADYDYAKRLNSLLKQKLKVHIKIDTGMGRLGILHKKAKDQIVKISKLKKIDMEGIYTHFPCADTDINFTRKQIKIFESILKSLEKKHIFFKYAHAANSIAACKVQPSSLNMIRPGIMLYGIYPEEKIKGSVKLKPVMSFKTMITYIKTVDKDTTISYGRTYTTKRKTRIATLPVGYADGYVRALSNKAKVIIRGKKYPVVGRVCMDQTMVDIGLNSKVKKSDIVTLIGRQKQAKITALDLAFLCKTIAYEITCWVSERVPRVFKNY